MKKSIFLLGLLTIAGISLTACGSKSYEMSFEDAVEVVNHWALQEALSGNDITQQTFDISTDIENEWTKIVASVKSDNKQDAKDNLLDSSTNFDVTISSEGSDLKINWNLAVKMVENIIYLNLEKLDFAWSEDASLIAQMAEWFKNQWFSLPMNEFAQMPEWLSNANELNKLSLSTKELFINEWLTKYEWSFEQFKWYNARKFSINNNKFQEIIKDYYASLNVWNNTEEDTEIPQLNISNVEWYLVITWKDKVTVVIDSMDLSDEQTTINANWFAGEDYVLNLLSEWTEIITLSAEKKNSHYNISLNMWELLSLQWTITPKVSKSSINIKFDAKITAKSQTEWESDTVIPLKGSRNYEPISKFTVTAPSEAQDLSEMIAGYLWTMVGWEWVEDYSNENNTDYELDGDYSIKDTNIDFTGENIESSDVEANEETIELTAEPIAAESETVAE